MSIRIVSTGSSTAGRSRGSEAQARRAPTTNPEPHRSDERDDRPAQPHQDETHKTANFDRHSDVPSSQAPATWCGDGVIVRCQQQPTFVTKSTQSRPGLSLAACRRWRDLARWSHHTLCIARPAPPRLAVVVAKRDGARGMRSVSAFRVDHAGAHPFGEATRRSLVVA
jgi:hypothetical protein